MIQATEIRIGNWFKDFDGKYFQWDLMHFGMMTLSIDADEIISELIPLTEEILLNCGFEKIEHEVQYQILICDETETENIKLLILDSCDKEGYFADIHEIIHMGSYTMNISKVKYLHQLQNIYWCLCGKELIIKL